MRHFRKRMHGRRFLVVSAVVGVIVLGGSAIAYAAYPTDSVAVMTGCLTTSGTGSGNIVNVAMGTNPAKSCGPNQKTVRLSGGTITQVTAGTGLTTAGSGGTDTGGSPNSINNGFAKLGLQASFALPQTCSDGQIATWDATNSDWTCANDQNTTYSGADFALSNQDCPSGQFATGIDASGHVKCADGFFPSVRWSFDIPANFRPGIDGSYPAESATTIPAGSQIQSVSVDITAIDNVPAGCAHVTFSVQEDPLVHYLAAPVFAVNASLPLHITSGSFIGDVTVPFPSDAHYVVDFLQCFDSSFHPMDPFLNPHIQGNIVVNVVTAGPRDVS